LRLFFLRGALFLFYALNFSIGNCTVRIVNSFWRAGRNVGVFFKRNILFFKVVIDARTDLILGAAIIGAEASEVITSIQMAMLGGLRWQQVRDAVITHPTMSEGLNIVLDSLG